MRLSNIHTIIVFVLTILSRAAHAHLGHEEGDFASPQARDFFESVFNDVRNIYTEPNSGIGTQSINEFSNEYINPFSGLLQLKYADILIPANGPDVLAQRSGK